LSQIATLPFALLGGILNKPLDIIFDPCEGRVALSGLDIDVLPDTSRVLAFADTKEYTNSQNMVNVQQSMLSSYDDVLQSFYYHYLLKSFALGERPEILIVGQPQSIRTDNIDAYLGKPITAAAQDYVYNTLDRVLCEEGADTKCYDQLTDIIGLFQTTHSSGVFSDDGYLSANYQAAYVAMDEIEERYKYLYRIHRIQNVLYDHKELDYCYIGVVAFKPQIDEVFASYEIPLIVDLSCDEFYAITQKPEESISKAAEYAAMLNTSDYGLIESLLGDGCYLINDAFPLPQHSSNDFHIAMAVAGALQIYQIETGESPFNATDFDV
jgi:hypothetical protein